MVIPKLKNLIEKIGKFRIPWDVNSEKHSPLDPAQQLVIDLKKKGMTNHEAERLFKNSKA